MKPRNFKIPAVLFLALSLATQAKSQGSDPINVVTSAVPFLRISPDARAGGMGDVGIATTPDAKKLNWHRV